MLLSPNKPQLPVDLLALDPWNLRRERDLGVKRSRDAQLVRTIFSALNRNVVIPDFMSGAYKINEFFSITYNRLYIIIFCFGVFFALRWILQHSRLGLEVRSVSQNRAMAHNMGVRSGRVNALTFGLGSGIAGLAGVALSQLTNVGPNLGQNYIVDSFLDHLR